MKIKNIIFDWDGTLNNSEKEIKGVVNKVLERTGAGPLSDKEFKENYEFPYMNFYRKYTDVSRERIKEIFNEEKENFKLNNVFPECKQVLEYLHEKGISMAILSGTTPPRIKEELKKNEMEKYFQEICADAHDKTKILSHLIRRNNFSPKHTAYIGDLAHDIEAGRKAGVITIAAGYGHDTKEKILAQNPDYVINSILEIKGFV